MYERSSRGGTGVMRVTTGRSHAVLDRSEMVSRPSVLRPSWAPYSSAEQLCASKPAGSRPNQRRWSTRDDDGSGTATASYNRFPSCDSAEIEVGVQHLDFAPHSRRLLPGIVPVDGRPRARLRSSRCNRYDTPVLGLHTPREHIFPALRTDCNSKRAREQSVALRSRAINRCNQV